MRVRQAVLALVDNALKYAEPCVLDIATRLFDDEIGISVIDQGPGTPDSFAKRAFEPFRQPCAGAANRSRVVAPAVETGNSSTAPRCRDVGKAPDLTGQAVARCAMTVFSFAHARISRYAPGVMAAHSHDTSSLTLVLNGRYEETIRGRTGWHGLGTLLFYPSGEPHAQRFPPAGALKLSLSPKAAMADYLAEHLPLAEAPVAASPQFALLGRRMAQEISLADPFSRTALEGLSWELIALFARHARQEEARESALVAKARAIIADHLDRPLSIARLAELCDAHPARLVQAFRRELNMGPGEHQRVARLKAAARMIAETATPLSEVALACGFCDQSHLSRAFKAAYGCTPTTLRRGS